ncbi:uncharacterized protein B0I36DRAFT_19893 [Microdochium trichocladiopsis]|uniref:Uncharacterized protein n=1 Tax=Microdochium trichocladiopsis TaxID=1682393 RepID=A0A9P9BWU7_9PEZI|nr:uncharacterized protein B0I36DRAFT_19893 [Microdochium trichocladiopsis]KAH7041142.1 hypothetical protein B0I36DRAFT_19893 [Microdochium trichocladiopsis]
MDVPQTLRMPFLIAKGPKAKEAGRTKRGSAASPALHCSALHIMACSPESASSMTVECVCVCVTPAKQEIRKEGP